MARMGVNRLHETPRPPPSAGRALRLAVILANSKIRVNENLRTMPVIEVILRACDPQRLAAPCNAACSDLPNTGASSVTAALVTIGGLLAARGKFAEERTKVLKDHPTAYLYEALGALTDANLMRQLRLCHIECSKFLKSPLDRLPNPQTCSSGGHFSLT